MDLAIGLVLLALAGAVPAWAQDAPLTTLLNPHPLTTNAPLSSPSPLSADTPLLQSTPLSGPPLLPADRADAQPGAGGRPCPPPRPAGSLSYGGAGPGEYGRYMPTPEVAPGGAVPAGRPPVRGAAGAGSAGNGSAARPRIADRPLYGGVDRPLWGTGATPASEPGSGDADSGAAPAPAASARPAAPGMIDRPLWSSGNSAAPGCGADAPDQASARPPRSPGFYGSGAAKP